MTPNGKLPPVLPLVLYNGDKRWRAAQDIQELIEPVPGGLERYRPSLRYLLLDELAIADEAEWSNELNNLAAAVFQLEQYREIDDLLRITRRLNEWLKAPEQTSLRRAFVVWLRRVVLPRRLSELELHEFDGVKELH
ncbi:Rpn family recombination-promoting nuclease/putative transposase [Pistricoccus aurantiacus]|uniref:Rpn family recombination-promoting nuclease/putative transposase n=1 Tax=Pistricoccus aurantiacus TaxID=1883414 RepID=UPI00362E593C